jgi:hypothetical protein
LYPNDTFDVAPPAALQSLTVANWSLDKPDCAAMLWLLLNAAKWHEQCFMLSTSMVARKSKEFRGSLKKDKAVGVRGRQR